MNGVDRYRIRCIEKLGFAFRGSERLLDAGCGDGGVARLLHGRVREVVAVDIEPHETWREMPALTFLVADAQRLPFDDASFDLVHAKDALHHMDDPHKALLELRRVLRPGGIALLIEANRYNPVFFVHMTKMLGHEHFTRKRFRGLVTTAFESVRFGAFEAHYVPRADRLARLQDLVEDALEQLHPLSPPLSYNHAIARRG